MIAEPQKCRASHQIRTAKSMSEMTTTEDSRIAKALRDYANLHPIDLKSYGEIQRDLRAIAGDKHTFRASAKIGDETCVICLRNLRHEAHLV